MHCVANKSSSWCSVHFSYRYTCLASCPRSPQIKMANTWDRHYSGSTWCSRMICTIVFRFWSHSGIVYVTQHIDTATRCCRSMLSWARVKVPGHWPVRVFFIHGPGSRDDFKPGTDCRWCLGGWRGEDKSLVVFVDSGLLLLFMFVGAVMIRFVLARVHWY